MKNRDLIKILLDLPQEAEVKISFWNDPESFPGGITGFSTRYNIIGAEAMGTGQQFIDLDYDEEEKE